jgi:hypothetical protein
MKIFKQKLEVSDKQHIKLPYKAKILTVQTQHNTPCIWYLCDEEEKKTNNRGIRMFGTGHPIPIGFDGTYISTFQLHGGNLVFHVFEI